MKQIILIALIVFPLMRGNAQNQISGKVIDTSHQPLVGATVFLPELNKGTITDQEGTFLLKQIPEGKIKMQFSFIGYNTQIRSLEVSSQEQTIEVTLTPAIIESQEVVVTGGPVSSQHDNAIKIDILKHHDIALSGSPNLMESLSQIPGVDMISKGQGVTKPVIRGLSMNDILVMNNGVRIENYQFSENHPLGIDDNDVERVEVIKGPASLLYGSDAIGGVLNFIKEKPAPTGKILGNYLTQGYTNSRGIKNSIALKGASKDFFGGLHLGQKSHADYLQGGGNIVPNSRFQELTFNANTGYTSRIGTFKVFYDYFKQDLGMTVPPIVPLITKQGRKNEYWYQDLTHQMISSQNNLYLGRFRWHLNAAYQSALRKLQTTLPTPFVEMNLNTLTYESKLYLPSNSQSEYIIGFQGMVQQNRNRNDRASQFLPDANIHNIGIMGLVQQTLFGALKLQGGLRADRYHTHTFALGEAGTEEYHAPVTKSFSNLNGSLGATYHPTEKLMLRANFAKAYRVPNLSELTSRGMHGARYEIGNDRLSPENSMETDVSIHYHSNYFSFDLAGFYNRISQYIFITPTSEQTTSGVDIYRFAQSDATLRGGEGGIHFHPQEIPWLHLLATYSSVIGKQQNGNYLPFIPANKIRGEIRVERPRWGFLRKPQIKLSTLSAFSQDHPSPYETKTRGYTLVNLSLFSELPVAKQNWQLSMSANNLFDKAYIDHLSTLKPLNYNNPGRNISVSLKIPFTIK